MRLVLYSTNFSLPFIRYVMSVSSYHTYKEHTISEKIAIGKKSKFTK
nr:MAG TPA: hypothetical protein [Caudoviricetes sp.]